jgi:hypothetical protein
MMEEQSHGGNEMKNQNNAGTKQTKNKPGDSRPAYEKPVITRHGNLKKITALSFQPPE